ncbi:MAG: ATP-binding protein [Acidimicrobiales bacterium]|nr:ATP-binding protein [Acidimicrobiales bacterium]
MHDSPLVQSLVSGLTAFRVACLVWLIAILGATRNEVDRPWVAFALVSAATIVTAVWVFRLRSAGPTALLGRKPLAIDVTVAASLAVGDGIVFDGPHSLSLGSSWPLTSVLSVAIGWGARGGAAAGVVVGVANALGDLIEGSVWTFGEILSRASTLFLYTMAGAMAGYASRRLIAAEAEIAMTRARDEVARTLHDGVLQTLAVVQRRSDDTQLAALAKDQERELREYLFGAGVAEGGGDLGAALRHVATRAEKRDGTSIRVVVAPDVPTLDRAVVEAVAGAVGEACTNAAKHGEARTVTVYAEPTDDGLTCSVKDDGRGFDPGTTTEGVGLTRSIRGRVADVGGRVVVDPNPGRGTEVRLTVPSSPRSLSP